ncbi:DUF6325 family protein [Leifsonia poae]|uniref:DUF1269 domain-containing family protein n=1 Tax=Leifsonia poae TaxID=110933 RepID=A0A9W6M190_9MICO|nr:DUF6325 family protein [Leifsonia poae]GLJ77685.1 DUF1269 domain-containing family protein [Leifsonia poae]
MAEFEYGPVEIFVIGFDGERPGRDVVDAILRLIAQDTVRLLDLLFVSRAQDGDLRVVELEEIADEYGLEGLEVIELGLAGSDDVDDIAEAIVPGTSAALLVVEHVWAREFAEALFEAGGRVLQTERIPAPVVNEMVAATSE